MKSEVVGLIESAVQAEFGEKASIELTRPDSQFGDFATNVALQLGKKQGKNPREVAQEIIDNIPKNDFIASTEIAGPGFINLTVTNDSLISSVIHPSEVVIYKNQKVVIETNNPNPFKPMHIGHAFNAILGDTIANLLEAGGAAMHRVSYHGDVGLHVGKSMYSLLKFVGDDPKKLDTIAPDERNKFMSQMYADGSKIYKSDEAAKTEIDNLTVQSFIRDDKLFAEVYDTCKAWSFEQIDELVKKLGNKPTEKRYLESEADEIGVQTVKNHEGSVFINSDGALVFPGKKYGIFDNVFVTSTGRGLYGARDLGLMQLKQKDFHAEKSYIVTAEEQKDYFRGVIKAAELCLPELNNVTQNISTGTVKLSTGKMSSRDGEVLDVQWLFDQIEAAIRTRGAKPTIENIQGALRYQFLKVRVGSDVIFDVDQSVALEGNTGPYVQYAHARACSILAKGDVLDSFPTTELTDDERRLVRKISEYSDVIERAASELMPHLICTYLYELAQEFNRFYEHNRVIDDKRQDVRMAIVKEYSIVLKNGLAILGIPAPEKM